MYHEQIDGFTVPMGAVKYTNQVWVKDNSALLALYYLGIASKTLPKFTIASDKKSIISSAKYGCPTLSPADPKFKMEYNKDPNAHVPASLDDDL